tara:strand:+ start:234 stop:752 length:519 start_codon:yes stop_codon:yes gene_type:complete
MISSVLYSNLNSSIDEIKVKKMTADNIYKKCNYKNSDDFSLVSSWNYNSDIIELWGKTKGNSKNIVDSINNINIDKFIVNIKIYGKCIFVLQNDNVYKSLTLDIFNDFLKTILESETTDEKSVINEENSNKEIIIEKAVNNLEIGSDNGSEYSYNSELTYELYCYSDEEPSL